jgi:glucose/arabinose dehydrogenase
MTVETSPRIVRTRRFARFLAILAIVVGCAPAPAVPAAGAIDNAAARAAGAAVALPQVVMAAAAGVSPLTYSVGHLALGLTRLPGTFSSPVFVANAGDGSGRLFIVEQGGRIKILDAGTVLATPFLDIHTKVSCCGEQGLLGLAFHPQYASNGRFFVYYTDAAGTIVVAEYHRNPSDANRALTTETTVLRIGHPSFTNHNGGMLAFGRDGTLYIGTGDGGSGGDPGNHAQRLTYALGKVLRININHWASGLHYSNPPSNPYVGRSGDDRVWAYGLRNPWRFTFDRANGDLWIGDVGQDRYEEIDRATRASGLGRARNYGWKVLEGRACYSPPSGCSTSGKTSPIAVYTHSNGCAVVGGYVARGAKYPAMIGAYLFSDYCSGKIWALKANGASSQAPQLITSSGLMVSAFGEGENGTLYVADLAGGGIYELVGSYK